jgi:hypothetical protein
MAVLEYWGAALTGLVAAAITGIVAWWQRSLPGHAQSAGACGKNGRGPYVRTEVAVDHDFVARLATTLSELREAARHGNWVVDWDSFGVCQARGEQAAAQGNQAQAVRDYGDAICFMMAELRQQNIRQANCQPGQASPPVAGDDGTASDDSTDLETPPS